MTLRTALLSVSDKRGLLDFARGLEVAGFRILSTGGTLKHLRDAGIAAVKVSEHTGSPEILDGRVKTLHPRIHGGILARRDLADHLAELEAQGIPPIDVVAVNLYPFRETVAKSDVTLEDAVENIDIGGPCMIRAAAKNHASVFVVCDPDDYGRVLSGLSNGDGAALRRELAVKAFRHTAAYDAAIDTYLSQALLSEERLHLDFASGRKLRYGENDHQQARFFPEPAGSEANVGSARQLHGKELSYNNLVDADAALEAVRDLHERPAVAIIKHTNPCGYATGDTLDQAFEAAWQSDPVSAFGSVIAVSRRMDFATAQMLKGRFVEVLIAPGFDPDALDFLTSKSKDLRLLDIGTLTAPQPRQVYKHILGGMLAQDRDVALTRRWDTVTQAAFPEGLSATASFAWKACKHIKSNAIAIGYEYAPGCHQLIGMGPGQPNRIDSNEKLAQPRARETLARIAEEKGREAADFTQAELAKCVLASDAFFPFDDNVKAAHAGGLRFIVQPGGSLRDAEVVATADALGMAMIFAGNRHFRH